MEKFESSVKPIPYPVEDVYRNISDLNNLERVRDRVPADRVSDFSFDEDTVSLNVPPVGELKLRVIERDEPKCVKFETEQSPVKANMWIQVLPDKDENGEATATKMRLTLKADLNPMIKMMLGSKLPRKGIVKNVLSTLHRRM